MPVGEIRVHGLLELQAAFRTYNKEVKAVVRKELRAVAEPVRARAETLALSQIRNIGPRWSRMRVGVTARSVYVAPKSRRGRGSPRPNLAPMLMDRAMQPALEQEEAPIVTHLELAIDRLGSSVGF